MKCGLLLSILCFINSREKNKSLISSNQHNKISLDDLENWLIEFTSFFGRSCGNVKKEADIKKKKIYCIRKEIRLQTLPPCVALPSPPGLYQHYPAIKISEDQSSLNVLILREPLLSICLPHLLPLTSSLPPPSVPRISPLLLHALHFDASTALVPPDCG